MDIYIGIHELKRITGNFSKDRKVGGGGFGNVYKSVYNGEEIAVKLLNTREGIDDKQFLNELRNHMKVQHPNIIRLVGYCNDETKKYTVQNGEHIFGKHIYRVLCFEYMPGGSLDKHISENSLGNDWCTHYNIIKGICEGLLHLHCGSESPILHLDLKPANILLDKNMVPKLADFGLSRIYTGSRTHAMLDRNTVAGTMKYMAPELRNQGQLSAMADIFSLGVTIIEVIQGSFDGFAHYDELGATEFIEYVLGCWTERDRAAHLDQVERCTKIAIRCVNLDRKKRPTIKEIVVELHAVETQVLSKDLHAVALSSSSGKLSSVPVPDKLPSSSPAGRGPLDVVIIYAFDSDNSLAWYMVDQGLYWMVYERLTRFDDSCFGFIYHGLKDNNYTTEMKLVEASETKATGYTRSDWRRMACKKNMASGLAEAHKMISYRGYQNGIILLFSDGLINNSDFFDGAESYVSTSPVHTFTLGGHAYDEGLHAIAANSPGGKFHTVPVPERPNLSPYFSKLLDSIIGGTAFDFEMPPRPITGREPLDVVIIYAFDSANSEAWNVVDKGIYWIVYEKLTRFDDSCFGFIYHGLTDNNYTTEMKLVDASETKATGYKRTDWRRMACTKNMASGLAEAHKMVSYRGYRNGIVLLFSDGVINKGDFFDGAENFVSTVPVHTFTLGGDAYNQGLEAIAAHSPGGKFHSAPIPERPHLSVAFSKLLDRLFGEAN